MGRRIVDRQHHRRRNRATALVRSRPRRIAIAWIDFDDLAIRWNERAIPRRNPSRGAPIGAPSR
jgi:hypothetical protein